MKTANGTSVSKQAKCLRHQNIAQKIVAQFLLLYIERYILLFIKEYIYKRSESCASGSLFMSNRINIMRFDSLKPPVEYLHGVMAPSK